MLRRTALVSLAVSLLAAHAAPALARPLTTPSPANEAGIAWYLEQAARKYEFTFSPFPDVTIRDPAFGAAALLKERGVINGFEDGTLRTWAPVTRAEALKIVLRATRPAAYDQPARTAFPDVPGDSWISPYVAAAVELGIVRGYEDGTFRPQGEVSLYELQRMLGLDAVVTPVTVRPALRGQVLSWTAGALPLPLPQPITQSELRLGGRDILANDTPVRGLMVNWQIRERIFTGELTRDYFGRELDKMREMGFIGVSTEIGWSDMQTNEDELHVPYEFTLLFEEAAKRGMWVTLMLAPHYTPRWLYFKYGDIWLKDSADRRVPMGEFMTYSLSSPAVEDQYRWQARAGAEFAKHPNLLALFLSNEQSYGNKQNLDFSSWTDGKWQDWRKARGLAPAPMPRTASSPERLSWARFRQDNLNRFLNGGYRAVSAALPRFVPVSHKVIFYEATSAYAPEYGLRPTPGALQWDIVGADIYGLTPNVYPAQLAHGKPITVVETNLPGDWSAEAMRQYLVYQALQGITIQTIYRWNPCDDENCLVRTDGSLWNKAKRIYDASLAIDALPEAYPLQEPSVAILIPANAVAVAGYDYHAFQYRFDELVTRYEARHGEILSLIWSDDLLVAPGVTPVRAPEEILRGIREMYFILPATDADTSDGRAIKAWIAAGGILRIDADQAKNLPWLGHSLPGEWDEGEGRVIICAGRC